MAQPTADPPRGQPIEVPLSRLRRSPLNPRSDFREATIRELARTIRSSGLLAPLVVRAGEEAGTYELAAGERRLRALHLLRDEGEIPADWPVPVTIRELSDLELLQLALVENLEREDLHPLDEGHGFARLVEQGVSTREIAERIAKSRRHVQLRIQLTRLEPELEQAFRRDELTLAQARLVAPADRDRQLQALEAIRTWPETYTTQESLRALLTRDSFPASSASFDLADYDGPQMTDPETGEVYLFDLAQVRELQRRAARRMRDRLSEGRRADEVALVEGSQATLWAQYQAVPDPPPESARTVLLLTPQAELRLFENLIPAEEAPQAQAAAPTAGEAHASDASSASGELAASDHLGPEVRAEALRIKNAALQETLASRPQLVLRVALLSLLQDPAAHQSGLACGPYPPAPPTLPGDPGSKARSKLEDILRREGISPAEMLSPDQLSSAWEAISELSDEEVEELFALLVASRVGTPAVSLHEPPLVARLAADLGAAPPTEAWLRTEYLQLHSRASLGRIAVDSGAVATRQAPRLQTLPKDAIIQTILESEDRDPSYLPPELRSGGGEGSSG